MRALLALLMLLPAAASAREGGLDTLNPEGDPTGTAEFTPFGDSWGHGDLDWALPSTPSFADRSCDVVVDPDAKSGTQPQRLRDGMSVCILPGTLADGLHLRTPGLRIFALEPGTVFVQGSVKLAQPAVVAGLAIRGDVIVEAAAQGSVLIGNFIEGALISETSTLVLAGNEVPKDGRVSILGRKADPALFIPATAMRLYVTLPMGTTTSNADEAGSAVGWVPQGALEPPVGAGTHKSLPWAPAPTRA